VEFDGYVPGVRRNLLSPSADQKESSTPMMQVPQVSTYIPNYTLSYLRTFTAERIRDLREL
jgi:hypothetical protein